ncbi:uncharacterized protein LOC119193693 [Manduca sexta]|uniref:uncharacterized protein LOC119193693 n=1 Tax=Manduca sexta TaxID=7130 RepID=UPI00188EB403|nr:uncharacterized protein LOC119193693 [Manduca sexta]
MKIQKPKPKVTRLAILTLTCKSTPAKIKNQYCSLGGSVEAAGLESICWDWEAATIKPMSEFVLLNSMSNIKHYIEYSRNYLLQKDNYCKDVITWTIVNVLNLQGEKVNRTLYSDESCLQNFQLPELRFRLKLKCCVHTNDIKLYYFLPTPATLSYEISASRIQGVVLAKANEHCIPANKWLYLTTLNSSINNTTWQRNYQNFGKEIPILFKFKVSFHNTNFNYMDELSKDFGKLLRDELLSDVTIKSAEGLEFKVHKCILGSRSAVLRAYFIHDNTESYTNTVESPFEGHVLQDVLMFIYSNKVLRAGEIPDKLLEAADYYQLDMLKHLCTQKLYEKLTPENAIDTLLLADRHHADSLKDLTLMFLKDKAIGLLKQSETWAKIESVSLLKYICKWLVENDDDGYTDQNNS